MYVVKVRRRMRRILVGWAGLEVVVVEERGEEGWRFGLWVGVIGLGDC